jgi:hypothetical protein
MIAATRSCRSIKESVWGKGALPVVLLTILGPGSGTSLAADPPEMVLKAAGATVYKLKEGGTGVVFMKFKLDEEGWKALESLPDLKKFTIPISAKEFGDEQLVRLGEIKTIETIFFNGYGGTEAGLKALAKLPNLRYFGADHTLYTGTYLAALKNSKNFTTLRLAWGFNDEGMKALGELSQLKELEIGYCRITSAGFPNFARLESLEKLSIHAAFHPVFIGADFVHFSGLKKLETLQIKDMALTYDDGLDHLKGLKLKLLKLSQCRVSDTDLRKLRADHPGTKIEITSGPDEKFKGWDAELEKRKKQAK